VRFFRAVGPGIVSIQVRALTSCPQPGTDSTWLHHTLREMRSPSRWRVQSNSRSVLTASALVPGVSRQGPVRRQARPRRVRSPVRNVGRSTAVSRCNRAETARARW
jgi:hypothetical protein